MRKVAILCPAYNGQVVCDFAITMAVIFQRAAVERPDLQLNLHFWMGEALIQKARSRLFCDAYDAGADDIVFIDSDQSFDADAFFHVLDHPVDAVGIPVIMKTAQERYNIRPDAPESHVWRPDLALLEVQCIGTGFLRLSRRAMQVLWDQGTPYTEERPMRLICDVQIVNGGMISEDVQLCKKLTDSGIKIYADIRHTCDHFGVKRYSGSYLNYRNQAITQSQAHNG